MLNDTKLITENEMRPPSWNGESQMLHRTLNTPLDAVTAKRPLKRA